MAWIYAVVGADTERPRFLRAAGSINLQIKKAIPIGQAVGSGTAAGTGGSTAGNVIALASIWKVACGILRAHYSTLALHRD